MANLRTYRELRRFDSIEDRFDYLALRANVGAATFGHERYLNQRFYTSREWRRVRDEVIVRDEGCDLGIPGFEIHEKIIIHHMNPVTIMQLLDKEAALLDPNQLVSVSHMTHNAIHYGSRDLLPRVPVVRQAGDTNLW